MRLYDLTEQYNTLAEMLEDDADNESLQAMLDGIEVAFDEKVESIVKLMMSKQGDFDALDNEAQRLIKRAEKINKNLTWLKQYVEDQMKRLNKEEVKSNLFTIKLANCPHAVNVLNESDIPRIYFVTKPAVTTLDKRTLLDSLKNGEVIPGAEMIQRKSLRIK